MERLVLSVYGSDNPVNCFPSTHVLTSYFIMRAFNSDRGIRRPLKIAVSTMAILIIASTVLLKQHVILDAVGAILVVEALHRIADRVTAAVRGKAGVRQSRRRLPVGSVQAYKRAKAPIAE
ncbi:hypothetical protein DLM86_15975 [Paenibacillus flagellatus]|uniref:Phosphatidic acid phosphatase type 2/haloperoxidase domain-containing protein n=1 Tax=Paenibacillus flagellatus TaxID=2211139 RepID=A0A2V5KHZ9_9BACL|nr:hypothetical protein DLM86_15975 [Paenibacillus flagellatus]